MAELPGIFNLALKGLKRLRENKFQFTKSKKVNAELQEYQEIISPITAFIDELLLKSRKEDRVPNKLLRRLFGVWCLNRGHKKNCRDVRF